MKTTYLLTSIAREGAARLTYELGFLIGFETTFKPPLDSDKLGFLISNLAVAESGIDQMKSLGLTITKEAQANEKLAIFCRIYEKHKSIKYKVTAAEAGKIKQINPTEEQLHAYFRSENFLFKGKQSISNLVKYWNEFRADLAGQGSGKFPNEWNSDLVRKLSPQETINYYTHLRGLGMKAIKTEAGQVVGYK
jgi:hypothetical protein